MGEQKQEPHDTNNGNDDREKLCLIQCPWGVHGRRSGEETIAFPSNQRSLRNPIRCFDHAVIGSALLVPDDKHKAAKLDGSGLTASHQTAAGALLSSVRMLSA